MLTLIKNFSLLVENFIDRTCQDQTKLASSEATASSEVTTPLAQVATPKLILEQQTEPFMQAFFKVR